MRRANPTSHARRVADALRQAGFPLVVGSVSPVDRSGGVVLDAVAYDIVGGELRLTTAVVTAPAGKGLAIERALSDLATARDVLGTSVHYIVEDGGWLLANPGLTSGVPVPHVAPALAGRYDGGKVRVGDDYVLTELLQTRLWNIADDMRRAGFDVVAATSDLLEDLTRFGLRIGDFEVEPDPAALWSALVTTVRSAAERRRSGLENVSPASVANAVTELLGPLRRGNAHDPFCGLGSFLWAIGTRARNEGVDIGLSGREINQETARLAAAVASFAPSRITIDTGDSLLSGVPWQRFDYIVSAPPMGALLRQDQMQAGPSRVRRTETAAIVLAAESLVDGGRAVLHLPNSWLFNGEATQVRELLTRDYSVLAIIGLPSGAVAGTNIQSNLLVFDKRQSPAEHETFIAQLGEDWAEQLTPEGGALSAYSAYLDGLNLT